MDWVPVSKEVWFLDVVAVWCGGELEKAGVGNGFGPSFSLPGQNGTGRSHPACSSSTCGLWILVAVPETTSFSRLCGKMPRLPYILEPWTWQSPLPAIAAPRWAV